MKPFFFSHRGDTRCDAENTMEAFKASLDSGVLGVETDVQLSSYGELLLFHDDSLMRLMNKEGTFHDLQKREVDSFRFSKGEKIPSLNELLVWLKENPKMKLYLELKFPDFCSLSYVEKLVKECVKSLTKIGFPKSSIIGSFDLRAIQLLEKYLTGLELDWPLFVISETHAKVEDAIDLGLDKNFSLKVDLYESLGKGFSENKNIALWGIKLSEVNKTNDIFAWVPDL